MRPPVDLALVCPTPSLSIFAVRSTSAPATVTLIRRACQGVGPVMWPLMLPHHPELLAAHSHPRLNRALDKNRSGTEPLLDSIAASRLTTGPIACSALALGLSAKNGDERTHAVDAVIDLADSGKLDGTQLGHQISWLLIESVASGQRVVQGLAEGSRASGNAANAVLDALQAVMPVLPGRRDAHVFVDLDAQLASGTRRTILLPDEVLVLRAGRSSSAIAAACRRVPLTAGEVSPQPLDLPNEGSRPGHPP